MCVCVCVFRYDSCSNTQAYKLGLLCSMQDVCIRFEKELVGCVRSSVFFLLLRFVSFLFLVMQLGKITINVGNHHKIAFHSKSSVRSWCDGSSDRSFMGWTH